MNTRFRLLLIAFGAALVVATFTFPTWIIFFQNTGETFPFPELDPSLQAVFEALPPDRQQNYLQIRRTNLELAVEMTTAALQADVVVPDELQVQPNLQGQQPVRSGAFTSILTPNRSAAGQVTIYELPDESRYLWLQDFSAIKAPEMHVFLSVRDTASLDELEEDEELALSVEDIDLGQLDANVGSQRFDVPTEADLSLYNSIILYSQGLNLVYSIADI